MTLPYGAERALQQFESDLEPNSVPVRRFRKPWRRGTFPLLMFFLTVLSTIWVGMLAWNPDLMFDAFRTGSAHMLRRCILANWSTGLQFSASLLTILLAHEFGHYLMMRRYGILSTYPIFIPFPVSLFGTMGAIIAMDPSYANRREIFDIGIAGPLAGLVIAVPLAAVGLLFPAGPPLPQSDSLQIGQPLLMYLLDSLLGTELISGISTQRLNTSSPIFIAAWVGFLITGLNMMPMSQLDGGHVAFGIFGKYSEWIAKSVFVAVVAYMIYAQMMFFILMLFLILMMGLKHPPSSDDSQRLGLGRTILGLIALTIPILCIPATPIQI
jgi:Zn-dependent protease